jgi:hypothetical protein
MSTTAPRVFLDISPLLFATALAKVLVRLGYEVDLGGPPDHHDLAVISEPGGGGPIPVQITLPPLESRDTAARVSEAGGSRLVPVHDLADLLRLIQTVAPTPTPVGD